MGKLIVWIMAACLLSGCGAIGAAPSLSIVADRPGCSTIARAFMLEDAPAPTADQVLSGVFACEERDRLGAIQLGQRAPGR